MGQQRGPSKAQKRRDAKLKQEVEREQRIQEEQSGVVSERAVENQTLAQKLGPLGLTLKEIKPDGHCLYRAVEDQLQVRVTCRRSLCGEGCLCVFCTRDSTWLLRPEFRHVCLEDARSDEDWKVKPLTRNCSAVVYGRSVERHRKRSIEPVWGILCCPQSLRGSAGQIPRPGSLHHRPYVCSLSICDDLKLYISQALLMRCVQLQGQAPNAVHDYLSLRKLAAAYMRAHKNDFLPFVTEHAKEHEGDPDAQFEAYCTEVEETATWGGQLELGALAHALRQHISVYSASLPVVEMGKEYERGMVGPLRLSYHQHAFGLGEHYNSIVPVEP